MYKNETTGEWEHDFRVDGLPRYRACYGTKKVDAERLHAVASAVFKARDPELVHALKRRGVTGVTLEQYAQLRERGLPFADALKRAMLIKPWPAIADAVGRYISALETNENRAAGTARAASTNLNRWLAFQDPNTPLDAVVTADIDAFQEAMRAEGYAPNTITTCLSRVGSLYNWFIRRERIEARDERRSPRDLYVPLDHETISTQRTRRERYLNVEEAERLFAATPRSLLFAVAAGLFCGFRVQEMLHLRTGFDVNLGRNTLAVQPQPNWRPKTARSIRHVPIHAILRPILEHQLDAYASEEWLVPSRTDPSQPMSRDRFYAAFKRVVEDAELVYGNKLANGVTYHALRHSHASWLLMAGADMYTVAKLLGNSVKQVEDTYGHLSQDHRQAAIDRLVLPGFATSNATSGLS